MLTYGFLKCTCSWLLRLCIILRSTALLHLNYCDRLMGNLAAAQQQLFALRDLHQSLDSMCFFLTCTSVPCSPNICCVETEHSSIPSLHVSHPWQQAPALLNLRREYQWDQGDKDPSCWNGGALNRGLHRTSVVTLFGFKGRHCNLF